MGYRLSSMVVRCRILICQGLSKFRPIRVGMAIDWQSWMSFARDSISGAAYISETCFSHGFTMICVCGATSSRMRLRRFGIVRLLAHTVVASPLPGPQLGQLFEFIPRSHDRKDVSASAICPTGYGKTSAPSARALTWCHSTIRPPPEPYTAHARQMVPWPWAQKPLGAARPRPSERSRPVNWSGGTFGCVVKLPCLVQ